MLAGELCDALDPELVAGRERARELCQARQGTRARHPGNHRTGGTVEQLRIGVVS